MKSFTIAETFKSPFLSWFADGIRKKFISEGYRYWEEPTDHIRVVFNFIDPEDPRPFRRKAQATFVISVLEAHEEPEMILKSAYPYLIRSLVFVN